MNKRVLALSGLVVVGSVILVGCQKNTTPVTTETTTNNNPNVSTKISRKDAEQIALEHANLKESEVNFLHSNTDYDDGRKTYEVEFYNNMKEYDYTISAIDGTIIEFDNDINDFSIPNVNNSSNNTQVGGKISAQEAKEIALKHANLKESEVNFLHSNADYDDGRKTYEVKFYKDMKEYDYTIDALTGNIVEFDDDINDFVIPSADNNFTQTPIKTEISAQKAKEIALKHANLSEKDITFYTCKTEYEHGVIYYEIEFKHNLKEYSYDIDSKTGKIMSFEQDRD